MDVRCEKCQTEYELDEARLKPGGVTVKCTNCGHMFKIRKRTPTNVGAPAIKPSGPSQPRADSMLGEDTAVRTVDGTAAGDDKQWLIRLENGEQKSCRELATLQQWIVACVVTRESLISRSGKTWKRLGDIPELTQYFTIADEARAQRSAKPTGKSAAKPAGKDVPGTMLGIGAVSAAGGTVLPDDDELRATGNFRARQPTPPPPVPPRTTKTPPMGSNASTSGAANPPTASSSLAMAETVKAPPEPARRPPTQPPPPPKKAGPSLPPDNRATGAWVAGDLPTELADDKGPAGPFGGRVKAASQEPAFAGKVRVVPGDDAAFTAGGRVGAVDEDDDDVLPERRGGKGGMLLLLVALLVMGAAAGVVYVFVIKKGGETAETKAPPPADAAQVAVAPPVDATPVVEPVIDAPAAPTPSVLDTARAELGPDLELKLRDALKALEGHQEPGTDAMRVQLAAGIAQALLDRAAITADKTEAEKLKKDAKQVVLDVAATAQRAFKAAADDPAANLAMAHVLRLQGKAARDIKRYVDAAKAKSTPEWKRDIVLAEALVLVRDGKLDDAKALLAPLDQGEDKLETTGDVRVRFQLARIAYAQNKPADAKPLVDQILAAQPEHAAAKALAARLETTVAKTDPLPPEETPGTGSTNPKPPGGGGTEPVGGDSYDRLLAKANALAERNCTQAMDVYSKALEQKPNGVEALTGMGYCHIDAKQYASAFSKFRAALAGSPRYEPALWGIGEAYQQQGRKEQAIDAFKKYLDAYPGSQKALKALERLGAGANTSDGSGSAETPPAGGSGSSEPAPQPPQPTPAPTPAPTTPPASSEGAGSGG